ncbi:MAG: hypothetical protein ACR2QM_04620 [Longimicrobiales bacterium]
MGGEMNWEAVGALAEAFGAIAVVLTLAYLTVQVRQNSRIIEQSNQATRITADDAVVENFNQLRELWISDAVCSDIYVRGMDDLSKLDEQERHRFNQMLNTFTWTAWQLWRAQSLVGTPNAFLLRDLLRHPGGRAWFAENRDYFPPDFVEGVDVERESINAAGLPDLALSDVSAMFAGRIREDSA